MRACLHYQFQLEMPSRYGAPIIQSIICKPGQQTKYGIIGLYWIGQEVFLPFMF
jgi:hypothetical protein